jgi:putative DNA primase/helicase
MATEVETGNVNEMTLNESKVGAIIVPTIGIAVNKPKQYFNHDPDAYASKMKEHDQWLYTRLVERPDGTFSKPPCDENGYNIDATNPNNLTGFENAFTTCKASLGKLSGLGFSIQPSSPIKAMDFDHVYDPDTGEWNQQAWEELKSLNTRVEWSPSYNGFHLFFTSPIELDNGNKTQPDGTKREIYFENHYLTVTGEVVQGFPTTINEVDPELIIQLYDKWFPGKRISGKAEVKEPVQNTSCTVNDTHTSYTDNDVQQKCRKSRDKVKFEGLYNGDWNKLGYGTQSEADEALLYQFAQHTQNVEQIVRLFSGSKLYDEKCHRSDYLRNSTIKAIGKVNENPFKKYFVEKTFVIKSLADDLMSEYRFVTMQDTKEIFIYENGVYQPNGRDRILQLAQLKLQNYYSPDRCNNTATYIATATGIDRKLFNTSKTIINYKNGLFDLEEDKFKPHTPNLLSTIQIPVSYNPDAQCPKTVKFLYEVVSEQDVPVLLELIGYCMIPDTRMEKSVMLIGEGKNGKSVFLKLLTLFIGGENTCHASLDQLVGDKFIAADLYGKLANISAETPAKKLQDHKTFNALVSGDIIHAQKKNKDPFDFKNTARLIFSANEVPPIANGDYAYFRRWILIMFPHKFEGKDDNKNLIFELTTEEELSGLLNLALEALKGLLKKGQFSYNLTIDEVEKLYSQKSNTVKAFADECIVASVDDLEKYKLYEAYVNWCRMKGEKPLGSTKFAGELVDLNYHIFRAGYGDRQAMVEGVALRTARNDFRYQENLNMNFMT